MTKVTVQRLRSFGFKGDIFVLLSLFLPIAIIGKDIHVFITLVLPLAIRNVVPEDSGTVHVLAALFQLYQVVGKRSMTQPDLGN